MQHLRPQVRLDQAAQQDVCDTALLYQELPVEMAEQDLGLAGRPRGKRKVRQEGRRLLDDGTIAVMPRSEGRDARQRYVSLSNRATVCFTHCEESGRFLAGIGGVAPPGRDLTLSAA